MDEVEFLVYTVSGAGIQPTDNKVKALHDAPQPKYKKELRAFLVALNFYNRFLSGAAHALEPLCRLLDENSSWKWTKREAEAFHQAKQQLRSRTVLTQYSVQKPLLLACDASPYRLGAVLSHVEDNGYEVPIAFGS